MALFSALQKFITKDGQPVEGASVIVKLAGSAMPATLYATRDGGVKSNPFLTDSAGNALCYVSPGRYDMTVTFNAEQVTFNDVEVGPVSQVGSFTEGVTLTDPDQWVRDSDGALWEYTGSTANFPLQVAPGSSPDNNFRVVVPNGGRQVSSVGSLRNTKARFNGETVQLVSYYAGANKGGGVFVWDAASTAADDGGVTIAVTGVATGRWVRRLDGYVTPEMFGARGDDLTDDYQQLQAAFSHPAKLIIEAKHYTSQSVSVPSNKRVVGLSDCHIRIISGMLNVIVVQARQNVSIKGLGVIAGGDNSAYANGNGIYVNNSFNVSISGCRVSNHRGAGVNIYSSENCNVKGNNFVNSPVQHLDPNSDSFADIAVVYDSKSIFVKRNICESGQGTGVQVQSIVSQGDNTRVVVTGNIVRNCKAYGIIAYRQEGNYLLDVVDQIIIANNVIENTYGSILNVATGTYAYGCGIYVQGAEGTVVSGNNVRGSHSGGGIIAPDVFVETLSPAAIGCLNVKAVNITGNNVENSGMLGIEVGLADSGDTKGQAVIVGNTVKTVGKIAGIRVRERSDVVVASNTVSDVAGTGLRAVSASSQISNIIINNNCIKNTSSFLAWISNVNQVSFSDNTLDTGGQSGALFTDCLSPKVAGNTIKNHTVRGIEIASSCSGNSGILSDNTVIGNGTSQRGYLVNAFMEISKTNKSEGCVLAWDGTHTVLREFYDSSLSATSGATETNLVSVNLPVNTFINNGDAFNLQAFGSTNNNANAKTLKVYVGDVEVAQFSLSASQISDWSIDAHLMKRAAGAQRCFVQFAQGGTVSKVDVKYSNPNQVDTALINIRVTGTGVANSDITKAISNSRLIKVH